MNLKPGDRLEVVTSGGADIDVYVAYKDAGTNKLAIGDRKNTKITTATTTTVAEGPTLGQMSLAREIETISLCNVDLSSNTVTVQLYDSAAGATCRIWRVTLAAGEQLHYDRLQGWSAADVNDGANRTIAIVATDVVNDDANADTLASVTGLSAALVSGATYKFRAVIAYNSAATTTGARFTVNGPTATHLNYTYRNTLTATTEMFGYATAYQIPAAAGATSLAAGNIAIVEGQVTPSADGTLQVQFASEVSASAVTVLAGSSLEVVRTLAP